MQKPRTIDSIAVASSPRTIYLDFETHDPYIGRRLGGGWCFKRHLPAAEAVEVHEFSILCAAYSFDGVDVQVTEDWQELGRAVQSADILVAHNAQYELGVLCLLGVDTQHLQVMDTMLIAKLYDNRLMSYGLSALAKTYLKFEVKSDTILGEIAKEIGLIKSKVQNPVNIAKKNMGMVYLHNKVSVQEYCKQDVRLTCKLYNHLQAAISKEQRVLFSDLLKSCVASRWQGVRIDIKRAHEVREILLSKEREVDNNLDFILTCDNKKVNINSSKQLGEAFDKLGIEYPLTEKGSPSFTKQWLESNQDVEVCKLIVDKRRYEKARRDFIDTLLNMQQYVELEFEDDKEDRKYGRVFPEINIMGATATGRASSSNPNIQQIPKRDKEIGPLVRSVYLPEEGEQWYSLDFSSQEPRLQVHYATQIVAPGADKLAAGFAEDPSYDLHGVVAEMAGISREDAKTVNLGMSYGMGIEKLAMTLGTNTQGAESVRKRYVTHMPYLKTLAGACSKRISKQGYIRTLGGRRLQHEKSFNYKALNKLIQGSAADQTYAAMAEAYRRGIRILFPIHDSLELSTSNIGDAVILKEIMETCFKLSVPSKTDLEGGPNWGELDDV